MLDINYIRVNPDKVKLAAEQKLMDIDVDRLLLLDAQIRKMNYQIDTLRGKRNTLSDEIKTAGNEEKRKTIVKVKAIKDELQ
ncbi:MAG: hypothetical protein FIA99_08495 [Ruminiclostridium sp.]|nr:hypothetical protein [Ruminiclostridium sp.]